MAEVLTTREAADYLRLSTDTVKRLARSGTLFAAKAGRQWRWRKSDLDEFLARRGTWGDEEDDEEYVAEVLRRMKEPRLANEQVRAELGL
jgi:excisionase family DNA binding protein